MKLYHHQLWIYFACYTVGNLLYCLLLRPLLGIVPKVDAAEQIAAQVWWQAMFILTLWAANGGD